MSELLPRQIIRPPLLFLLIAVLQAGCASHSQTSEKPAVISSEPDQASYLQDLLPVYDPWEPMNRSIYDFNARFDRYVWLPIVSGYEWLLPNFAQTGVSNFFNNTFDINNIFNGFLQGEAGDGMTSISRLLINSTVGVLGFFDVASSMDIPRPKHDFGETLGVWGVNDGPYVVLPFLGPSNLRDSAGSVVDLTSYHFTFQKLYPSNEGAYWGLWGLSLIDERKQEAFRYYSTGSPFEYELIRYVYTLEHRLIIDTVDDRLGNPPIVQPSPRSGNF